MVGLRASGKHLGLALTGLLLAAASLLPPRTEALAPAAPKVNGAAVFASAGCTQCHGPAGMGTEKGPSLRDLRKRMDGDAVYKQIEEGGQAMPPFGDALDDDQITALVEFLRGKNPWPAVK